MQRKNLWLLIPFSIIGIILFIGVLSFFEIFVSPFSTESCGCHNMMPNYFLLVFGILLILAVIPISYYFISRKMEDDLAKHMKLLSKFVNSKEKQKSNSKNNQPVLKFFNTNEKIIIDELIKNDGVMLQSEISKMKNMTKLKVHRIVKNLKQKEVIKIENYGKTNKVIFTNDFKKSLKL